MKERTWKRRWNELIYFRNFGINFLQADDPNFKRKPPDILKCSWIYHVTNVSNKSSFVLNNITEVANFLT